MYARPISSAYLINSTKPEIPAFFVSFLDGGLLWKNFQCFTDSSVIIASKIIPNASLPAFTIGDRSTGVGDVMLGFIPTVSYVCIIVLLLLVIISRVKFPIQFPSLTLLFWSGTVIMHSGDVISYQPMRVISAKRRPRQR